MSVMEGSDGKLELIGMINHGLKVGNCVAMRVDVNLATESSAQSLPGDRLGQILVQGLNAKSLGFVTPIILLLNKLARLLKGVSKVVALTHTAKRQPSDSSMHALRILAACHLH